MDKQKPRKKKLKKVIKVVLIVFLISSTFGLGFLTSNQFFKQVVEKEVEVPAGLVGLQADYEFYENAEGCSICAKIESGDTICGDVQCVRKYDPDAKFKEENYYTSNLAFRKRLNNRNYNYKYQDYQLQFHLPLGWEFEERILDDNTIAYDYLGNELPGPDSTCIEYKFISPRGSVLKLSSYCEHGAKESIYILNDSTEYTYIRSVPQRIFDREYHDHVIRFHIDNGLHTYVEVNELDFSNEAPKEESKLVLYQFLGEQPLYVGFFETLFKTNSFDYDDYGEIGCPSKECEGADSIVRSLQFIPSGEEYEI